jgi:hypothetical protein
MTRRVAILMLRMKKLVEHLFATCEHVFFIG